MVKLPATFKYLLASERHPHPAIVAPFGFPDEPEPGVLRMKPEHVRGVHMTLLKPDGSGKAGTDRDKFIIGKCIGFPIVVAPPNDGLALAIAEGIEDALALHAARGIGAWAAGAANRMPALADTVPRYIESVLIAVDDDEAGRRNALELAARLDRRLGCEINLLEAAHA